MDTQRALNALLPTIAAALLLCMASAVGAQSPPEAASAPSKQTREQMAGVHEKMAACLRSSKPIAECRNEMHASCQKMMGDQGCPMMSKGMEPPNR